MNISEVKELMDKFDHSSLREFSWKNAQGELDLSKNERQVSSSFEKNYSAPSATPTSIPENYDTNSVELTEEVIEEKPKAVAQGEVVKSPLVGVVYLKSSPEKPQFVNIGDTVKKGQTLLIIEAMKVMNEVPAPKDGVITEILVATEDVVEFGQELVRIK